MALSRIYLHLSNFWSKYSVPVAMVLVFLAAVTAFWLRSQPYFLVINSVGALYQEARLDELDPFVNYWIVSYMDKHGPLSFFDLTRDNPVTCLFWYPECRDITRSELPGHIYTIYTLYQVVKPLGVSLYDLMAFIPPLLGALGTIFTALAVKEGSRSNLAAVIAAFTYALMFISRESAGFTVKYSFGLFTAPLVLWLQVRFIKNLNIINAILAGIALAYAASVWTGIGLTAIPIYITLILAPIILDLSTIENAKRYSSLFALEIVMPVIAMILMPAYKGGRMVLWVVFLVAFAVYGLGVVLQLFLGRKRGVKVYLLTIASLAIVGAAMVVLMATNRAVYQAVTSIIPVAGKILLGLGINPGGVAETVAQYRPGYEAMGWHSILHLMVLVFLAIPIAIYDLIKYRSIAPLVISAWGFLSWYANFNTAYFDDYMKISLAIIVGLVIGRFLLFSAPTVRVIGRMVRVNLGFEKFIALLLAIAVVVSLIHIAYGMAQAYEYKTTLIAAAEGFALPTDVWLRALDFIRRNTSENALVISWWDYGYWLSVIGNRSTVADGATINSTKIHRLAQFFTSSYDKSYVYLKEFGACKKDEVYIVIFSAVDVYVDRAKGVLYIAFPVYPYSFGDIPKFISAIVYLGTGVKAMDNISYNRSEYQYTIYTSEWVLQVASLAQTGLTSGLTISFVSLNLGSPVLLNATLPRLFMWAVSEKLEDMYPGFIRMVVPTVLGLDQGNPVIFINPLTGQPLDFGFSVDAEALYQDLYEIAYVSISQPQKLHRELDVYRYVFVTILRPSDVLSALLCS